MKTKINRYEVTDAQRAAIAAGTAALGEIVMAHKAANPHDDRFEIELKVSHERKLSCWDDGPKVWGFFRVGTFSSGGCGHGLDVALKDMWAKTDASEKRASAERCRKAAAELEAEAAEMERAQAEEAAAR